MLFLFHQKKKIQAQKHYKEQHVVVFVGRFLQIFVSHRKIYRNEKQKEAFYRWSSSTMSESSNGISTESSSFRIDDVAMEVQNSTRSCARRGTSPIEISGDARKKVEHRICDDTEIALILHVREKEEETVEQRHFEQLQLSRYSIATQLIFTIQQIPLASTSIASQAMCSSVTSHFLCRKRRRCSASPTSSYLSE